MFLCVRTTVEIRDELLRQAKRKAADEGLTLREIVDAALTSYLSRRATRRGYRLQWGTERGRLLPGVSLDDRDALFDLMDGRR